jgi:hypothetical protein
MWLTIMEGRAARTIAQAKQGIRESLITFILLTVLEAHKSQRTDLTECQYDHEYPLQRKERSRKHVRLNVCLEPTPTITKLVRDASLVILHLINSKARLAPVLTRRLVNFFYKSSSRNL